MNTVTDSSASSVRARSGRRLGSAGGSLTPARTAASRSGRSATSPANTVHVAPAASAIIAPT